MLNRLIGTRRLMACLAAAMLALAAYGCSSPTTGGAGTKDAGTKDAGSTSQPWDDLTGSAREQALVSAAKKEGTLSVYSSYNDEPSMAKAFTAKYGIKVEVYQANSESILQRVLQETTAGSPRNDVLISPAPDMEAISDEGVLRDYGSEYRDRVPDKGKGAQWTGVRRLAFVAAWNTDLVDTDDVPSSYADFADPKWKGQISLEYGDMDWYTVLRKYYLEQGKSKDEVTTMFEDIATNAKTVKGHTVQGELLAAGQFKVAMSVYTQTVDRLTSKGAPVSFGSEGHHLVKPVVVRYDAGGVMKDTNNPAGASLYLDFQLSKDGFAEDEKLQGLPPIPQPGDPLAGTEVVEQDVPAYVKVRKQASEDYELLLRSGSDAK